MQPGLRITVLEGTLWNQIIHGGCTDFSEVPLTQPNWKCLRKSLVQKDSEMRGAASHNHAVQSMEVGAARHRD